jgi:hypothetical protein
MQAHTRSPTPSHSEYGRDAIHSKPPLCPKELTFSIGVGCLCKEGLVQQEQARRRLAELGSQQGDWQDSKIDHIIARGRGNGLHWGEDGALASELRPAARPITASRAL